MILCNSASYNSGLIHFPAIFMDIHFDPVELRSSISKFLPLDYLSLDCLEGLGTS